MFIWTSVELDPLGGAMVGFGDQSKSEKAQRKKIRKFILEHRPSIKEASEFLSAIIGSVPDKNYIQIARNDTTKNCFVKLFKEYELPVFAVEFNQAGTLGLTSCSYSEDYKHEDFTKGTRKHK